MSLQKACVAAALVLLAAGCATLEAPERDNLGAADPAVQACARWYQELDAAVDAAGVRDAEEHRIAGFPYLRTDRFGAALAARARADAAAFDAWSARMLRLDLDARRYEFANLSRGEGDLQRTQECARVLAANDLAKSALREQLFERARVPDDYLAWQRALGLYPLTRLPFSAGVEHWHEEALDTFRREEAGAPPAHPVERYAPPAGALPDRSRIAAILARAARHPLGVLEPSAEERELLFAAYAPVFEVETSGAYDRPGALRWAADGSPELDLGRPSVYRRLAHTLVDGQPLVQLVYTLWFPERPRDGALDMLAGRLDGIVLRVTLAPDGEPLVYDSIHPCGCYHMFFPTARVEARAAPQPGDEWMFAPRTLPRLAPGERIVLRIASRTHYLKNASPGRGAGGPAYAYADEDELRALALPSGGSRSLYGPDGLVAASVRPERLVFWPMGVPSAGTMRQWGHHATAFLGRRHFDDADLIERRFRIVAP